MKGVQSLVLVGTVDSVSVCYCLILASSNVSKLGLVVRSSLAPLSALSCSQDEHRTANEGGGGGVQPAMPQIATWSFFFFFFLSP